jgi:pimeloyl-ACP methyl ester carboxylesterase
VIKFIYIFAAGYVVFCAILYFKQRQLLYFPDSSQPNPLQVAELGLRHWPHLQIAHYRGWIDAKLIQPIHGTVLVCHGNSGAAWNRVYYVEALRRLGYRVILLEYPGYGGRPGEPSERIFVTDIQESLQQAYEEFGGPIYLWGESLGAGVAAAVAKLSSVPIRGLILLTPWDILPELAQSIYWYLPARWLVKDQYNTVNNISKFQGSIAILIADKDKVIPAYRGRTLYTSFEGRKRMWIFRNAGHDNWPTEPQAAWWEEVMSFVSRD